LRAGVARTILTPPVGISHGNWGAQTHARAAGVDLDLYGTALVLAEGDTQVAIIDTEFCVVADAVARPIRTAVTQLTGIPFDHVRLSYTHTHSGPSLGPTWLHEGDEMVPAYVNSLPDRLAGAVWQAQQALRPARVAGASGSSAINVNRRLKLDSGRVVCGRNWDGFVDREVKLMRIDDADQRPIATVVNYGAHPTIMGPPNQLITPDYPGIVRRVVEHATSAPCVFLQGAAGNVHAVVDYVGDPAVYHRLGAILGHEAARLALETRTVPTRERIVDVLESGAPLAIYADEPCDEPDATLRASTRRVRLQLQDFGSVELITAEAERLAAELEDVRGTGDTAAIQVAMGPARRAHMAMQKAQQYAGQSHVEAELHGIRIGDIALVGFPGEPFAEIGVAVKYGSPFRHTLFSGYTNDYLGYLPIDAARPDGGYEIETTPFAPGSADAVIEASLALLRDLSS
jgi:hypothetical protein